ncbi:electron transfer flavoprotein subunit beta/FixA family protein [Aneurinibacillus terranovensis]|uniref:electron transfer flavoprotein subunit beta/FixA family protein n=1 Tax=Aneurinibacillus terranovensis TaxID=278991 RepID=UPI00040D6A72|nr:electron transfer flavoprotein subunit beta/FixA family protein [Aneurinibacillus terranovensis]
MNILVILKETFDTEEKITIQNGQISEDGVEFVINPYDEYAVEEAIKLKEEFGGEVIVVTVGPSRVESALRTALAMGADNAVIVDDESLSVDEFTISQVLAAIARKQSFDIILAGNMSVDNGAGQVGPRLAEELKIPHVTTITNLSIKDTKATVIRDVEGDSEVIEISLPFLATAQQGLNEPRYPSLPGIMKAKKKLIERLSAEDLGLNPSDLKAKTQIIDQYLPPKKEAGRILSGELDGQIKELVHLLRTEAKVV